MIYPGTPTPDRRPVPARSRATSSRPRARPTAWRCWAELNRDHAASAPGDARLDARIRSYELAAKMQLAAPEALDLVEEPEHMLKLYGLDHGHGGVRQGDQPAWRRPIYFGRKCLVARRLLERGVRFVQIWSGNDNGFPRRNWDSHEDVQRDHGPLATGMARGAAALIQDLKQRGLLDDTIVLWTTEFGRMPCTQGGKGRDHNPYVLHQLAGRRRHQGRRHLRPERRVGLQAGSTASIPRRSTTSTPRSCTCSASTTRGSPSATTASTAG